jgi:hypothetical protein
MSGHCVGISATCLRSMGLMREAILLEIPRLGRGLIFRAMGKSQTPGSWRFLVMLSASLRIWRGEHMRHQIWLRQRDMGALLPHCFSSNWSFHGLLLWWRVSGFVTMNVLLCSFSWQDSYRVYLVIVVCSHGTHQRKSKVLFYCYLYKGSLLLVDSCEPILTIFSHVYYASYY